MDSHTLPDCRPLVGPGNTNHALDGPRQRQSSLQHFIMDMGKHLDATNLCWRSAGVAVELPPQPSSTSTPTQFQPTKKPQANFGLGVRLSSAWRRSIQTLGPALGKRP